MVQRGGNATVSGGSLGGVITLQNGGVLNLNQVFFGLSPQCTFGAYTTLDNAWRTTSNVIDHQYGDVQFGDSDCTSHH
eukprot:COSAG01_NODE_56015_length_321_cov_0.747748_1_plen_77_part_01